MSAERRALRGLYAITPEERDTAKLAAAVRAAIEGGAAAIQYRAKGLPRERQLEQARVLASMCAERGALFIVNDSVEIAGACGADGVHLGRDDGDVHAARRALPRGIIGVSCYDEIARVRDAAAAGADYVAIGSVFASSTKPNAVRAPLALLGEAGAASGLPVVAIGGVTADNARAAIEAGADMIAVVSAVFGAKDVAGAARAIARLFETDGANHVRTQPRAV